MKYFTLESNGGGWFKCLYQGKYLGKAQESVTRHRQAGWTATYPQPGSVGIERARTFTEAVEMAGRKLAR